MSKVGRCGDALWWPYFLSLVQVNVRRKVRRVAWTSSSSSFLDIEALCVFGKCTT